MANSSSFAALARQSKRGVVPTLGTELDAVGGVGIASPMSIGAVDDDGPVASPIARNPFSQLKRGTIESETPAPRTYEPPASAFSGLVTAGSAASDHALRKDIYAVKVVTTLVQGIAFAPGSTSPDKVKTAALRDQLVQVHRLAEQLAKATADGSNPVRPWMISQCSEVVAGVIARSSERNSGKVGADRLASAQVDAVVAVLHNAQSDQTLALALDAMSNNEYQPVKDIHDVRDRVVVSIAAATWDLSDRISESGFLYGQDLVDLVEALSKDMVKVASDSNVAISNVDMQTAHLQGSIRRLASLIGAEYASRTKRVVRWIEEGVAEGDLGREAKANASFTKDILPEILTNARRNFVSIEKFAPKLIEDARQVTANSERPASPKGN